MHLSVSCGVCGCGLCSGVLLCRCVLCYFNIVVNDFDVLVVTAEVVVGYCGTCCACCCSDDGADSCSEYSTKNVTFFVLLVQVVHFHIHVLCFHNTVVFRGL